MGQQNSRKTLIGVHSTHAPQLKSCNYYLQDQSTAVAITVHNSTVVHMYMWQCHIISIKASCLTKCCSLYRLRWLVVDKPNLHTINWLLHELLSCHTVVIGTVVV